MSREEISLLVHKKLTGQLSDAEKQELDATLSKSEGYGQLSREIEAVWSRTGALGDDLAFDGKAAFQKFKNKIGSEGSNAQTAPLTILSAKRNNSRMVFLRYAAAAAAVFVTAFFAIQFFSGANLTTVSTGSQSMVAMLPDGSRISLAANSEISYDKSKFTQGREISLRGTAVFEVEKTGQSFSVHTDKLHVAVMGTTFMVSDSKAGQQVKVMEGKVAVNTKNKTSLILQGREGANLQNGQLTRMEEVTFNDMAWTEPEMVYNNEPVSRVISDIEAKFGVKISLKSVQNLDKCTFTSGSLKNNRLEEVLSLLEATYATKVVRKSDKEYTIGSLNCS
ncbi:MAG: FecR family protein [Saprospiraceae bacterium]|nr:FecR family protein [Saprospiraceae bacterium]